MEWAELEKFGIIRRNQTERASDEFAVNMATPSRPAPHRFHVNGWFDQISDVRVEGMFLLWLNDHLGMQTGGFRAIHLCGAHDPTETSDFDYFLERTGLTSIVRVNPFGKEGVLRLGEMDLVTVREDPLRFLTEIDPGPNILFHPFYAEDSVDDTYYQLLARQMHRVISGQQHLIRSANYHAGGRSIVAGFSMELFQAMLEEPPTSKHRFEVCQHASQNNTPLAIAFAEMLAEA